MDISELIEPQHDFLNAQVVEENNIRKVTVKNFEGISQDQWGNDRVDLTVESKDGEEYKFSLNLTNRQKIAELFGTNTDDWIGKEITLTTTPTQKGKGVRIA